MSYIAFSRSVRTISPYNCIVFLSSIGGIDKFSTETCKAINQAVESIFFRTSDPRRSDKSAAEAYKNYQTVCRQMNIPETPVSMPSPCDRSNSFKGKSPQDTELDFIAFLPRIARQAVEVLWGLKGHLLPVPEALVALLISAPTTWPEECRDSNVLNDPLAVLWLQLLPQLYALLAISKPIDLTTALRLLAPDVADQCIRHWAVTCLSRSPSDALIPFLPALMQVSLLLHILVIVVISQAFFLLRLLELGVICYLLFLLIYPAY